MWDALILPLILLGVGIAAALTLHGWPSFINVTHVHNVSNEFRAEESSKPEQCEIEYVCLASDPVNTINKLDPDSPNWNMHLVKEGIMSGMLRYATKQEVAAAIRDGLVKT